MGVVLATGMSALELAGLGLAVLTLALVVYVLWQSAAGSMEEAGLFGGSRVDALWGELVHLPVPLLVAVMLGADCLRTLARDLPLAPLLGLSSLLVVALTIARALGRIRPLSFAVLTVSVVFLAGYCAIRFRTTYYHPIGAMNLYAWSLYAFGKADRVVSRIVSRQTRKRQHKNSTALGARAKGGERQRQWPDFRPAVGVTLLSDLLAHLSFLRRSRKADGNVRDVNRKSGKKAVPDD